MWTEAVKSWQLRKRQMRQRDREQGTALMPKLCCQPGSYEVSGDRITSSPELGDRCVTSFLGKKKRFKGF